MISQPKNGKPAFYGAFYKLLSANVDLNLKSMTDQ